jgi:hypothetical protein
MGVFGMSGGVVRKSISVAAKRHRKISKEVCL